MYCGYSLCSDNYYQIFHYAIQKFCNANIMQNFYKLRNFFLIAIDIELVSKKIFHLRHYTPIHRRNRNESHCHPQFLYSKKRNLSVQDNQ